MQIEWKSWLFTIIKIIVYDLRLENNELSFKDRNFYSRKHYFYQFKINEKLTRAMQSKFFSKREGIRKFLLLDQKLSNYVI
jgi:hypothetical protein